MTDKKWEIGLDGYPVDPNHPWYSRESSTPLEDFIARELDQCKRSWEGGNFPALSDAMKICSKYDKILPSWANQAIQKQLLKIFERKPEGKHGRTANPKSSYRQNWIHFQRWATVQELRERSDELREMGYKARWTDDEVFLTASDGLKGQPGAGSASAIRSSYLKVQMAFKEGGDPRPYTFSGAY